MKFCEELVAVDRKLAHEAIEGFVPKEVHDIHAHFVTPAPNLAPHLQTELGWREYSTALQRWLPGRKIETLFFGFPSRGNDRIAINRFMADQIARSGSDNRNRGLVLVAPEDDRRFVDELLETGRFVGLKPYHCYAPFKDTTQAKIEDFAPEWMWETCHRIRGVLMLHIMRDQAIDDAENLSTLRRLCARYPECRLVLAHVARSFNYRNARKGLHHVRELENAWVDTSAITEADTFRRALDVLGPGRILYGSDYPVSESRGRCVATGNAFNWFHPPDGTTKPADGSCGMTLIGIESLLCLREAAEDFRLGRAEIDAIFFGNARKLLGLA